MESGDARKINQKPCIAHMNPICCKIPIENLKRSSVASLNSCSTKSLDQLFNVSAGTSEIQLMSFTRKASNPTLVQSLVTNIGRNVWGIALETSIFPTDEPTSNQSTGTDLTQLVVPNYTMPNPPINNATMNTSNKPLPSTSTFTKAQQGLHGLHYRSYLDSTSQPMPMLALHPNPIGPKSSTADPQSAPINLAQAIIHHRPSIGKPTTLRA